MTDTKIVKLIADVKSSIAKLNDQVLQLEALVAGENPVRDVIAFWCSEWKLRYAANYDVTKADAGNFKRLVTANGLNEMKQRVARYLADGDRFLVQQKHPLSMFFKRVSGYATPLPVERGALRHAMEYDLDPSTIPADCRHDPPCHDDIEHTRRRTREMRA
jgi:hypothetical protein